MFTIQGECYCINGCLKYPVNNKKVFNIIRYLAPSCIVEEAEYYKISPENFHYDGAMEGRFKEYKLQEFLATADFPYTFIFLDFHSFSGPCRLLFQFFDNDYYGISLLFSSDVSTIDSIREQIIFPFYQSISPIYGNNGVEKAVFSLNQIDSTDCDLFNSDFMLNSTICEKIGKKYLDKATGFIPIRDVGVYFPQQPPKIFEPIFQKFLQIKI